MTSFFRDLCHSIKSINIVSQCCNRDQGLFEDDDDASSDAATWSSNSSLLSRAGIVDSQTGTPSMYSGQSPPFRKPV